MLAILTGLSGEQSVAKAATTGSSTLVLCGQKARDNLDTLVPKSCTAIMSFGLCGGLAPQLSIGSICTASKLMAPSSTYIPDGNWAFRIRCKLPKAVNSTIWYSSGLYNTANTPAARADIKNRTGAWVIDDESLAVAQLAQRRKIPFLILRSVSDGSDDTVPPAAFNATNPDGTSNLRNVFGSLVSNPVQIGTLIKIGMYYRKSIGTLQYVATQLGPDFLAPTGD